MNCRQTICACYLNNGLEPRFWVHFLETDDVVPGDKSYTSLRCKLTDGWSVAVGSAPIVHSLTWEFPLVHPLNFPVHLETADLVFF